MKFDPAPSGATLVVFSLESTEEGPSPELLERQIGHDLVIFKDYVERGGMASGVPTPEEEITLELEADRHGASPRHVRLSSEEDTTFKYSHFPT